VDGVAAAPLALLSARGRATAGALRGTAGGSPTSGGAGAGSRAFGGAAALLAVHAVAVGLGRPAVTAAVLAALLGLAVATAMAGRLGGGDPVVGAVATLVALLVPAGLGAALADAAGRAPVSYALAGLALSTVAVLALRKPLAGYLPAAGLGELLAGLAVAVASVFAAGYPGVPVLCAVLVGVAVLRYGAPDWYQALHLALTILTASLAGLTVLGAGTALLLAPYAWLSAIWSGRPTGVGLVPPGTTGLVPTRAPFDLGSAALTCTLLALAVAIARLAFGPANEPGWLRANRAGWRRATGQALGWAAAPAALAVLSATAALDAPWPTVAGLSLAIGLGAALYAALRPASPPPAWPLALLAFPATGAGLAGTLATKAATLTGLTTILVTAIVCAVTGRRSGARITGWIVAVPTGALLAFTAARALDVTPRLGAFWVLAAAAVALGVSGALRADAERRVVETAAHASAVAALLLTAGVLRYAAPVFGLWGIALGLRAQWPGEPVPARRARIVAAVACELVAYWLLLWVGGVRWMEAYTEPAAGVALLAGWLAVRTRPQLHSWTAYGPALLAGFGPSLALVLTVTGEPLRRLALGLAGVIVVVAGAVRRRQAPIVVGGTTLGLLAIHEAALLWDLLPRWIPLAAGGLVLLGLAITYERRRRDLRRLREAVDRMR
jgi:hypothetical protein